MLGNFALTQVSFKQEFGGLDLAKTNIWHLFFKAQAIVVGFLASIGAVLLKFLTDREFNYENSLVLVAGSMSTASFASLLLGIKCTALRTT